MELLLPTAFSLLVAAAGWFYLFYSRAALRLAPMEGPEINRRRVRLRQVGGFLMLLLAICFFAGFRAVDWDRPGWAFAAIWLAVLMLLGLIVLMAVLDQRLTWKLQRQSDREDRR